MIPHTQRVLDFISAWEARDTERVLAMLTPDALYHNIPLPPCKGRDEIRRFIAPFLDNASEVRWTVHHIAENAQGVVLTERTDLFVLGPKRVSIRVMGCFEFKEGLISSWRDYFDLAEFQKQMTPES